MHQYIEQRRDETPRYVGSPSCIDVQAARERRRRYHNRIDF